MTCARQKATVVRPSPGNAEVNAMTWGSIVCDDPSSLSNIRNASAKIEKGWDSTAFAGEPTTDGSPCRNGTTLRQSSPSRSRISSAVVRPRKRASFISTTVTPRTRLVARRAATMLDGRRGKAAVGRSARVINLSLGKWSPGMSAVASPLT